jgi:predicted acyl esterase
MLRVLPLTLAAAALAAAAPAAQADTASVLGGQVPCTTTDGVTACAGVAATFDGAPIDVNVAFPATGGPFPLIGSYHGWGGSKNPVTSYAKSGYAGFSMSDRGWGNSCGNMDSKRLGTACENGYNHLMDTRYEVRDSQYLISILADEGIAIPDKIGASGGSYGGGISMALAALRNRVMDADGTLIPWSDMAYSLTPTGRTLDYVSVNDYGKRGGIMKTSFVAGLFGTGAAYAFYAPPGYDEDADLVKWYLTTNAGEPYDDNPLLQDALDELTTHHSSYYIDHSITPAPLLIDNGFTDDLFPPDEAIRFYNRTKDEHPDADIAIYFGDHGHQRGQGKTKGLGAARSKWFDYFLKGKGEAPEGSATVETIACGKDAEGPFSAPTWRELSPGEIRFGDAAAQTIVSGGDPQAGRAFDPIAGGGACATADSADAPGTANYRLAVTKSVLAVGAPTVLADVSAPSPHAQIAARLLDVAPDGGPETLVARGLYRPDASGRQVFQLHPTAYRFEPGHEIKLELLAHDSPYARPSNGAGPVTVSGLQLRLPTYDAPDGEQIKAPAAKVLPAGRALAGDYKAKAKKKSRKKARHHRRARRR